MAPPVWTPEYGAFDLSCRFNVDSTGISLLQQTSKRFVALASEVAGKASVHRACPGSASKRMCTLDVLICADPFVLPPWSVIFAGKFPCFLSADNKAKLDATAGAGVAWVCQPSAWRDRSVTMHWLDKTFLPWKAAHYGDRWVVLLMDNLLSQRWKCLIDKCRSNGVLAWFGEPGGTHRWQPVDAGAGLLVKQILATRLDSDLALAPDFAAEWTSGTMSRQARRELLLSWLSKAREDFFAPKYEAARRSFFRRTGVSMRLDGVGDGELIPEGFSQYTPPPPGTAVPAEYKEELPSAAESSGSSDPSLSGSASESSSSSSSSSSASESS